MRKGIKNSKAFKQLKIRKGEDISFRKENGLGAVYRRNNFIIFMGRGGIIDTKKC